MSRPDLDPRNEAVRPDAGAAGPPGERWRPLWEALELPPVDPPPPGFAARVQARLRAETRAPLGLPLSPSWARAAIAGALLVGVAGGAGLGWFASSTAPSDVAASARVVLPGWSDTTLAEDFVTSADSAVAASELQTSPKTTTRSRGAGEQP